MNGDGGARDSERAADPAAGDHVAGAFEMRGESPGRHEGVVGPGPPGDTDRAADIIAGMGDATPLRSVAAIVVGFIVLTFGSVLAGRLITDAMGAGPDVPATTSFLALSLGSRLLVAVIAGFLAARAAPRRPFLHAAILAGVITFMALAALGGLSAAGAIEDPAWYPTAMLFVGPAGVLAGGWLRASRLGSRAAAL